MSERQTLMPLIPLREMVAFPMTIIPILVGREKSIVALKAASTSYQGYIFLAAQRNQTSETPTAEEIYPVGTVAR
ncbi:MAG TPA: LON peptidase substrate-binding domain-containing protein, partial [Candidatus Aminicenantes bacterium]|nr:LON peptidase substrate-binding domain-containing protein [Candidatus Aminicenantes bacterium]